LSCAGVTRDLGAALDWYVFAAESGHAPAQNNLGRLLIAGKDGVPADTGSGLQWLQAAAEQGSAAAWFNMGTCFEWGVGECAVDIESAQECYWHAAELGHQAAAAQLEQLQQGGRARAPASALGTGRSSHTPGKQGLGRASPALPAGGPLFLQQELAAVRTMHQVLADLQLLHA
jgi:TPR repeat protein